MRFPKDMLRNSLTVIFLAYSLFLPAKGAEVTIPLTIPFELFTSSMVRHTNESAVDMTILRYQKGCSHLVLDNPHFGNKESFIKFVSHGVGNAGIEVFDKCLDPIDWQGYIEFTATPSITPDWQLHLKIDDSNLYDEAWQKGLIMGPIWDAVQLFVLPSLTGFTINLLPPRDEALSLLRSFVSQSFITQADAVFRSAQPKSIRVDDEGVNVDIALSLPMNLQQQTALPQQPVKPLSQDELNTLEQELDRLDAFLVFIIKNIGGNQIDATIRQQLLELLLTSRYEIVAILSDDSEVKNIAGDPVRRLFMNNWNRLQEILRSSEQRGVKLNDAFRYAALIRAGNLLLTFDRVAPGIGMEISKDGLLRLAHLLQSDLKTDPLQYSDDEDPELRKIFGLPPQLPEADEPKSDPALKEEPDSDPVLPEEEEPETVLENPEYLFRFFGFINNLQAAELPQSNKLSSLKQRLDRWVPKASEYEEYKAVMNDLLLSSSEEKLKSPLESRFKPVFRNLMLATALKESCWRQFVIKNNDITYLSSPSGSIGLMQINPRVWRGFFNMKQIKWNVHYNALAGAEILSQYWLDYAIKAEKSSNPDNIARSTYAIYNAGPASAGRFRAKNSTQREKKIDNRFWEIYRGFKANEDVDLDHCTVNAS